MICRRARLQRAVLVVVAVVIVVAIVIVGLGLLALVDRALTEVPGVLRDVAVDPPDAAHGHARAGRAGGLHHLGVVVGAVVVAVVVIVDHGQVFLQPLVPDRVHEGTGRGSREARFATVDLDVVEPLELVAEAGADLLGQAQVVILVRVGRVALRQIGIELFVGPHHIVVTVVDGAAVEEVERLGLAEFGGGVVAGLEDDEVIVRVEDEEYLLPLENIQRARLVPQFD